MNTIKSLVFALTIYSFPVCAQVGIGTNRPDASSVLEIRDSTKGLLIPRMKTEQRTTIQNPAKGLLIYQTDAEQGYWYFDGNVWRNLATSGGKQMILFTDTVTNAQAQTQFSEEYGPNTQSLRIVGCTNLTSLNVSSISSATEILIADNPVLQSVDLSGLKRCNGRIRIINCPQLTTINLSSLSSVLAGSDEEAITLQNTGLTNVSLSSLTKLIGNISFSSNPSLTGISMSSLSGGTISRISINNHLALTSVQLGAISRIQTDFTLNNNNALTSLSMPALQSVGWLDINNNTSLTQILMSALTQFTGSNGNSSTITACSNLTNIGFGTLTTFANEGMFFTQNRLSTAKVNELLAKLVAISPAITGKTISLSQLVAAPPTGQGITDRNTLTARGNNVFTD